MPIFEGMDFGKEGEYWIAVDLDGTLAEYHGWKGPDHIGDPIPNMVEKIRHELKHGHKIAIFTARAGCEFRRHYVQRWLTEKLDLGHLEITNVKQPKFKEFWDDRAERVIQNVGDFA